MREIPQQNTKYSRLKKQLVELQAELEKEYSDKTVVHDFMLAIIRKLFSFILYLYRLPEP